MNAYAARVRRIVRQATVTLVLGTPPAALSMAMAVAALPGARAATLSAAIVVAHLALAGRRAAPMTSFAVVCAAFATQALVSGLFLTLPSALVFPVAVYSLCAWGTRSAPVLAGVAGVTGAAVAAWRLVTNAGVRAADLRPDAALVLLVLLAVVAVAISLGLYRRTQLAYVSLLEEQARRTESEHAERARQAVLQERQRIAREMHDVVTHSLAVMVNQAKGGQYAVDDPQRVTEVLNAVENTGRQALTDMRGLVGVLRPDTTSQAAERDWKPQPGLRDLPNLLERTRGAGLTVDDRNTGTARSLSPAAELAVYRLVQEALTNIVKHGGDAAAAHIDFHWGQWELAVTIRNELHAAPSAEGGGHGLIGMRERLATMGGAVSAGPDAEGGFTVVAKLPYPVPATEEARA